MSNHNTHAGASGATPRDYFLKEEPHVENGTGLGFWLYLMSDCLIFAALFATYGALGRNYAGGAGGAELFDLPLVAMNTALLLFSSITFGFAMLQKQKGSVKGTIVWLLITALFGLGFIALELYEFHHLIHSGNGPQKSAFLSAFFALAEPGRRAMATSVTPLSRRRLSQARSNGAAFMSVGNTRPELPMKVSMPSS